MAIKHSMVLWVFAAISCSDPADPGLDASADAAQSDAWEPAIGQPCPMGCNLELCADTASQQCETGICVWDGRAAGEGYCSRECANQPCPAGWRCLPTTSGEGSYCFAEPAVCGNGIIEKGEVCDTGNDVGTAQSGCALDCKQHVAGGAVTFQYDGTTVNIEGTSQTGTVDSGLSGETRFVNYTKPPYKLSVSVLETDLVVGMTGPVSSKVYLETKGPSNQTWCWTHEGSPAMGQMVTITSWDGTRLEGTFDTSLQYLNCWVGPADPPPSNTLQLSQTHFVVTFLAK